MKSYVLCHCTDRCIAPIIAEKCSAMGGWQLFGLSNVFGMGCGEWGNPILEHECDDVIALNRMDGKPSYVAYRVDTRWGLLQIKDNGKLECEYIIIEAPTETPLDVILASHLISKSEYLIGEQNKE